MQTVIGLLWLLDAAFASGETQFVSVCLAAVQIFVGFALIWNFRLKAVLTFAMLWSSYIWIVQNDWGHIIFGQILPLYGASGTALLFGIVSAAIWPARKGGPSVWNERGARFAQVALGVLFAVGFILHFQVTYLIGQGTSQFAEGSWFQTITSSQGSGLYMILAVSELVIALMFITGFSLRWAVWLTMAVDLVSWALQSSDKIADPLTVSTVSGFLVLAAAVSAGPKSWWYRRKQRTDTRRTVLH